MSAAPLIEPSTETEDFYTHARHEYQDRYAELAARARNAMLAAVGFAGLAFIALTIIVVLVRQARLIPYVVQSDEHGAIVALPQPLTPSNPSIDMLQIEENTAWTFIRDARERVGDKVAEDSLIGYVNAHSTGPANALIGAWMRANNPYLCFVGKAPCVTAEFRSFMPVGPHSFQIRWTEHRYNARGLPSGDPDEHWWAAITTAADVNPDVPYSNVRDVIEELGKIKVTQLNWSREDLQEVHQ